MPGRGNVLVGKCPVGEFSVGNVSGRGVACSGKCPSGKYQSGSVLGEVSVGELSNWRTIRIPDIVGFKKTQIT